MRAAATTVDPVRAWADAGTLGVHALLGMEMEHVGGTLRRRQEPRVSCTMDDAVASLLLCTFSAALRLVETGRVDEAIAEVDPTDVIGGARARLFGQCGHAILTTAIARVWHANAALGRLLGPRPRPAEPHGTQCAAHPLLRTALLLRLFVGCHLDLLAECAHGRAEPSDATLCTRPSSRWPSPYEALYPWGTRCRWAAHTPQLCAVLDRVHWFAKDCQHRWPLLQCLQKACPHKYMKRNWQLIVTGACLSSRAMRAVTASVLLCTLAGGYAHAGRLPRLPALVAAWRAFATCPDAVVAAVLRCCPSLAMLAWKEAVAWHMELRPDLLALVTAEYQWPSFWHGTVAAANAVRDALAAAPPHGDDPTLVDPVVVERAIAVGHGRRHAAVNTRVLRLDFKTLACKHFDAMLRRRLHDAAECVATARSATAVATRSAARAAAAARSTAETVSRLSLLPVGSPSLGDVMRVAPVPAWWRGCMAEIRDDYELCHLADTAAKRGIEAVADAVDAAQLRTVHRLLSHACTSNSVAVLRLSMACAVAHVRVLGPDDRPAYLCTSCGRVGATVVGPKAPSSRTAAAAGDGPTWVVRRGLKDVAHSFAGNCVYCNRRSKKGTGVRARVVAGVRAVRSAAKAGGVRANVPKHVMDSVLLRVCGTRPMICIDKCGVLIRIGRRVYVACCSCGAMQDVRQTACFATEPLCTACAAERAVVPAQSQDIKCAVCAKRRSADALVTVAAFCDTRDTPVDVKNRVDRVCVCRTHVETLDHGGTNAHGLFSLRALCASAVRPQRPAEPPGPDEAMCESARAKRRQNAAQRSRLTTMRRKARSDRAREVAMAAEIAALSTSGVVPHTGDDGSLPNDGDGAC